MPDPTMPAPARGRPSRTVVVLVLLGHVLAGVALGIALDRHVLHPRLGRFGRREMPLDSAGQAAMRARMREEMVRGLSRELALSDSQRVQVEGIIGRHEASFDAIRRESEPRLRALLDSTWMDIDRVLTPEQHAKWAARRGELPFGRGRGPRPPGM